MERKICYGSEYQSLECDPKAADRQGNDLTLEAAEKIIAKVKILSETVALQNQQITAMQPKAFYYDVVLDGKDLVTIGVIAKEYGWSANRMNRYLHDRGIQFKRGQTWLLYQKYAQKGYTGTKTYNYSTMNGYVHCRIHTYWTQAGRGFIYNLLKADGILPLIEKKQNDRL